LIEGILLATVIAAAPQTSPDGPCLRYERNATELAGKIERVVRPGPPNFDDVRKGDAPETIWILRLTTRTCVVPATASDDANESEKDVAEVQLVLSETQYRRFASLIQQEVKVRGPLFHAHTGHHHTRVLQTVSQIQRAASKSK